MAISTDELNHLIATRRTVFPEQYDPEVPVADEVIEQMLINANWAPNHGQTEPWRFKVYTGKGLKTLADMMDRTIRDNSSEFKPNKLGKLLNRIGRTSHIIAIMMKRDPYRKIRQIEEVEAVACAVQNMHLTATAYGVGAFWSTGGATYIAATRKYFGLEEEDELLGFFFVGTPAAEPPKGHRKPISEKVEWIRD